MPRSVSRAPRLHFIAIVTHDEARPEVGFEISGVLCQPADENDRLRLVIEHEGNHRPVWIAGDAVREGGQDPMVAGAQVAARVSSV